MTERKPAVCPKCQGTGTIPVKIKRHGKVMGDWRMCEACGGTGEA